MPPLNVAQLASWHKRRNEEAQLSSNKLDVQKHVHVIYIYVYIYMYTYMCVCGKCQGCCKVRLDKITTTTTENGTGSEDAEQGAVHHSRNYV